MISSQCGLVTRSRPVLTRWRATTRPRASRSVQRKTARNVATNRLQLQWQGNDDGARAAAGALSNTSMAMAARAAALVTADEPLTPRRPKLVVAGAELAGVRPTAGHVRRPTAGGERQGGLDLHPAPEPVRQPGRERVAGAVGVDAG